MSMNKFKIIVPTIGVVASSAAAYEVGRQQSKTAMEVSIQESKTAIEIATIQANSNIEVAKIGAKSQIDLLTVKADLSKNLVKAEANQSNVINNVESVNSPLEIGELKDLILNFDFSDLSFEILVGICIFTGTFASLWCIFFLVIYVTVYKLDLPLENYYSGYMLKLINFVKPFSNGFIGIYLTLLVCAQMTLFILSLRLLSGY